MTPLPQGLGSGTEGLNRRKRKSPVLILCVGIYPGHCSTGQEVLCTLAIPVLKYDIDSQVTLDWELKMDPRDFLMGTSPPAEIGDPLIFWRI